MRSVVPLKGGRTGDPPKERFARSKFRPFPYFTGKDPSGHLRHKRVVLRPGLGPEHHVLADKEEIVVVLFSGGKRGHSPDLSDGRDDVSGTHGNGLVLFLAKNDKGAAALGAPFLGPVFSDNVEGRSEKDEFVIGADEDFSLGGMRIGVLVEGEIPDQEVSAHGGVVSSEDLAPQDRDLPLGERVLAQKVGEPVRFLPGDEGGRLGGELVGAGRKDEEGQDSSGEDHSKGFGRVTKQWDLLYAGSMDSYLTEKRPISR